MHLDVVPPDLQQEERYVNRFLVSTSPVRSWSRFDSVLYENRIFGNWKVLN